IDPYGNNNIGLLSLGLHGMQGGAAWEEANLDDFLRELCLLKYFEDGDAIHTVFAKDNLLSGNERHLVRNIVSFTHQTLVYGDPNLFSFDNVVEGICRHPELVVRICKAFALRFDPKEKNEAAFGKTIQEIDGAIDQIDTGQLVNDVRRKNVLKTAASFVKHVLKTNFYLGNKSAFSFRLDPSYMDEVPFDRKEKFPEIPFGIFFIRGMYFLGFHIRFKDLARGGVRTVTPERMEQYIYERNNIFGEAYMLAYTQQKKNKDIPEGGAKTAILLRPFEMFAKEEWIYQRELEEIGIDPAIVEEKLKIFRRDHKKRFLFASQRSFIDSFMSLINCDNQGNLKQKEIVDLYRKPEYIYLGPDENMLNEMIDWIANYAAQVGYAPGRSFMSSKPVGGINHKEYGVTSFGIHVYLEEALSFLGIDPKKNRFTLKMSGGPDGDVAGNEIHNLATHCHETACLLAVVDGSGTIYDPHGLSWKAMDELFLKGLPIHRYPAELLHEGGFLLDLRKKRDAGSYAQETLCIRKINGRLVEEWLSGNETNALFRSHVHKVKADVFITGGGRPRTLNENNINSYLDDEGKPTSRAIVEGANLYLTPGARRILEKIGTIIFKDSSCNKGGVICSSFEVLAGLCMSEADFLKEKPEYVKEVLHIIGDAARNEARLLLRSYEKTGRFLTDLSDEVSERINLYKYQLLDALKDRPLDGFLTQCLIHYAPPIIQQRYQKGLMGIPALHKQAVIAAFLAARLVYQRGLDWIPGIEDVLPTLMSDRKLFEKS
ncbi:MAG: glutamate dehydrogenase 2, partial [Chlamydiota bacterium]